MINQFQSAVVGVTFHDGYVKHVYDLDVQFTMRGGTLAATLVRDPSNAVDANAIEVHAPCIGKMIGHLPAKVAAKLAPLMDAGENWTAEFTEVFVNPNHPDRPGIGVDIRKARKKE